MKAIEIHGHTGDSTIYIGECLRNLKKYVPSEQTIVMTDAVVRHYYGGEFPSGTIIELGTGEGIKTLDTARAVYGKLMDLEADRATFIIGIGGGIVCDVAGFVASTYMRGLRFGFVPSTLLAQVDASTGGKNGVNYDGFKNMVGVFNQPDFVVCDLNLLKTLPQVEIRCGLAEIVKHAAIADAGLFSYLEDHCEKARGIHMGVMEKLVTESVRIKSSIVNRDEKERGERRKLNFGHTLGHAVENASGLPHGEAVGAGMAFAARLSARMGYLSTEEAGRIETLLTNLGLPTRLPLAGARVLEALKRDKKKEGEKIHFVLLHGIGRAVVEQMDLRELGDILQDMEKESFVGRRS